MLQKKIDSLVEIYAEKYEHYILLFPCDCIYSSFSLRNMENHYVSLCHLGRWQQINKKNMAGFHRQKHSFCLVSEWACT